MAKAAQEEKLVVRPAELERLVDGWPSYRGQDISTERVRCWLEQADSVTEQRILFKLLSNVRFFNEIEIRRSLKVIHERVKQSFPIEVKTSRRLYRRDIVVSYLDGEGKSGQYYAAKYAEENSILGKSLISSSRFQHDAAKYEELEDVSLNGVIFVDDIVASGDTMSAGITKFMQTNLEFLKDRSMSIVVVVLICTSEGQRAIEKVLQVYEDVNISFRYCELLSPEHFAFAQDNSIWDSNRERDEAIALCNRYGSFIQNRNPLGYRDQGLLVVFPDRCPNNTLPILHGACTGKFSWSPLFSRPKN